jgi:hypothetical protein
MDDPIQEFKNWYLSKPIVTRTYMAGSVILGLLTVLDIVTPYHLYYNFESGILGLQLWRMITTVLFHGKLSFSFIMSMYFAHFAINNVETQLFDRRTSWADFLWLIIMLYTASIVVATFFPIYFTSDAFIFALMYIWCKRRPFETIQLSLMFIPSGVSLKSGYFPWIYMGFNILLGESWILYILGLLLGHLYIFFKDIMLPKTHKDYLPTPKFFKNWIHKRDIQNA